MPKLTQTLLVVCISVVMTLAQTKPYQVTRSRQYDLLHTRLEVRPDWASQRLNGKATLTLCPLFYPQSRIELDAKGFEIQSVTLLNSNRLLRYGYDQRKLSVDLGRTYSRMDTLRIEIRYTAKPNELPQGGSEAITGDKGLYFINADGKDANKPRQLWTQGETEASSCWFPTFDTPNEKMTQEVLLTVENGFKTLSNGKLISSKTNDDGTRTDYWKQDLPHSPYLTMMAAGDFAVVKDKASNGIELSYYVEPKFAPFAKQIFGRTAEMMSFFEQKTGVPFAWDKYAQIVVRDYVSGAMENTTATIFGEYVHKNSRQLLDGNDDGVIAHELFHHWFGDLVTAESWSNLPLNESFADYSEYLWAEHKNGKEEAEVVGRDALEIYLSEAENKQEPLIRYHYADKEDMFDAHSYQKGGRVLHLLRNYVGDEAFWASLNRYLTKNRFQNTEIHDLRKAFEETTGEDLNWFFEQWFMRAGHPNIDVSHNFDGKNLNLSIKQTQDSTTRPIYKMRLAVEAWTDGVPQRHTIWIDQKQQTFTFPTTKKPDWVLFDADNVLVGTVQHNKTRPELEHQCREANSYVNRLEAIKKLFELETPETASTDTVLTRLLLNALEDKFWRMRQFAANKFSGYDGNDSDRIERALQSAVRLEKRNSVRADAIYALASFNHSNNNILFKEAIADSSYLVAAAGLEAYLASSPTDADTVLKQFEEENNVDILAAIGGYYGQQAEEEYYDWYITKLNEIPSSDKYRFLQAFGTYLLKSTPVIQIKTIPILEDIARHDGNLYTRFGAYMALRLLTDNKGVEELLQNIRKQETNAQLKQVYGQVR